MPVDQTLPALPSPSTGQPGKEFSGEIFRWLHSLWTDVLKTVELHQPCNPCAIPTWSWQGRWDQEWIWLWGEAVHSDLGGADRHDFSKTLWYLCAEMEAGLCSAQIGVGSLMMCWSLFSSFPYWVLEEKVLLEGWEWDGSSAAPGPCKLCRQELSAFSVYFSKKQEQQNLHASLSLPGMCGVPG